MRSVLSCVLVVAVAGGVAFPFALSAQDNVAQLQRDCDGGDLRACYKLGETYQNGSPGDRGLAETPLQKSCDGNVGEACFLLGEMYSQLYRGVPIDSTRAFSLFERGCALDNGDSCTYLGSFYKLGVGPVALDLGRASTLYDRGCNLGHIGGCVSAEGVYNEQGPLPDSIRQVAYMQKACDLGQGDFCTRLGLMFDVGFRVAKDTARANELYKKGCLFNVERACGLIRH